MPARPGVVLPSFIFALYNENTKPGQTTEQNFRLLWPNGSHVSEFKALPPAKNNKAYPGPIWCVVKGANRIAVAEALSDFRKAEKTCYFGGAAAQTVKDPSYGSCKFPAVKL
ncbi:hypothetical protein ACLB2K_013735 [Fragaria x ananassa]